MIGFWSRAYSAWRFNRAMKQAMAAVSEFQRQGSYSAECWAIILALKQIAEADVLQAQADFGLAAKTTRYNS